MRCSAGCVWFHSGNRAFFIISGRALFIHPALTVKTKWASVTLAGPCSTVLLQYSTKDSESLCQFSTLWEKHFHTSLGCVLTAGQQWESTNATTALLYQRCFVAGPLPTKYKIKDSIYSRVCQIPLFAAPCALLLQNLAPCFTCEVINVFIWKKGYFVSPPSAAEFPARKGDVKENPQWQEAYAPSTCGRSPLGTHVVAHSIPSALTQAVQGPPALSCTQHPLPLTCSSQHKPTWLQPAVTLRRSGWKLHRSHDQVLLRTGHGRAELLLLPAATGRLAVSFLYFYPSKRAVIAISYRCH